MRPLKHMQKHGQSGQTLVILAVGFLALLGFVGIVTDVSMLFVRYSTMRRAVDAAAIAAAGQMRRVIDETPEDAYAQGEATSVANLNLAARQFIEIYGLDPKSVIVETCRAQQVGYDGAGHALDSNGRLLLHADGTPNTGDPSPDDADDADPEEVKRYLELCTKDELKLVRVTAQIDAPTIFLSLLGYPTVTLTESAISQTAVIDVVLIFDVSESMLNQTTYEDWDTLSPPQGVRYMPPYINADWNPNHPEAIRDATLPEDDPDYWYRRWDEMLASTQAALNTATSYDRNIDDPTSLDYIYQDKIIAFEPLNADGTADLDPDGSTLWKELPAGYAPGVTAPSGRQQPREFCQVRAYPLTYTQKSTPSTALREEYLSFFNTQTTFQPYSVLHPGQTYGFQFGGPLGDPLNSASTSVWYQGEVPMYNYFGCCNDPNGDFDFGDLICQPFKQARTAASDFLARLDFLRGDRVAFVTFDRSAKIIDPDGNGPQSPMIETENNLGYDSAGNPISGFPAEQRRKGAVETMQAVIGVRAEPSFYQDQDNNGQWDHLVDTGSRTYTYAEYLNTPTVGSIYQQPIFDSCPLDLAVISQEYNIDATKKRADGSDRIGSLIEDIYTVPDWYFSSRDKYKNYEYRASCAGTNMGAALASGSLALADNGRTDGSVWIMVLLSDGAAGASDPITRFAGLSDSTQPVPFAATTLTGYGSVFDPIDGTGGPGVPDFGNSTVSEGGYGTYGVCPYGPDDANKTDLLTQKYFPYCSDVHPDTRHYCNNVAQRPDLSFKNEDADHPNCFNYYDVDDYARDWADWIGLAELPNAASGGDSGRISNQLLPTIFTIGFGLNFDEDPITGIGTCSPTDYNCMRGLDQPATNTIARQRRGDYLGEELLRYIADVGDNFQIDTDYWQSSLHMPVDRIGNSVDVASTASPEWGARGPCETAWAGSPVSPSRGDTYSPLPPRQSCGNYFNASSGAELEVVFNEIASRMFTRLAQ